MCQWHRLRWIPTGHLLLHEQDCDYFWGMSSPICSRCQKIYTAESAPTKCINCGGDVRIPRAATEQASANTSKTATPVAKVGNSISKGSIVNRRCCRSGCEWPATHSIKYYYTGKRIVIAPAPAIQDRDARDLCPKHASEFSAPNTWTLVQAEALPSLLESPDAPISKSSGYSQNSATGSTENGCLTFIFGLIGFAIIAVVGVVVVMMIIDFLSGLDSSGTTKPMKFPFRWRR